MNTPETTKGTLPARVPAELNLLRYPITVLNRRQMRTTVTITYQETENKTSIRRWTVHRPSGEQEFPGPFEHRVLRVVEEGLISLVPCLPRGVRLPPLSELCRRLGVPPSGKWPRRVKLALKRLAGQIIDHERGWFDKSELKWRSGDRFSLFSVHFRGEELPDGTPADGTWLVLHPIYWMSLNSRYVRYLDWAYYCSLENATTQRLYEILLVQFATLQDSPYTRMGYLRLCDQLPLVPEPYLSQAKRQLDPHHRRLTETGFLADWQWGETSGGPVICYWPGPRAQTGIMAEAEAMRVPTATCLPLPGLLPDPPQAAGKPEVTTKARDAKPDSAPRQDHPKPQQAREPTPPQEPQQPDRPPYLPRNFPLDHPVCQVLQRFADRWNALSGQVLDVTVPRAIKEIQARLKTTPLDDLLQLVDLWFDPGLRWVTEAERGGFHTFIQPRSISELKGLKAGLSDERRAPRRREPPDPFRKPEDEKDYFEGIPEYMLIPEQRERLRARKEKERSTCQ